MGQREFADLEIGLHRRGAESYFIDLRYTPHDSDTDNRLASGEPFALDGSALIAATDPAAYGVALSGMLFAQPRVREGLLQARAGSGAVPLRVRLFIDASAAELHGVRWETLADPVSGEPLLRGEQLLFSRYLSSSDWRGVQLRPQRELRALIAVAGPGDLDSYGLAPVDVAGELERAQAALGPIASASLAGPGAATLSRIIEDLRGGYDILYLVCHGAMARGKPVIYLEDAAGNTAVTLSEELVQQLKGLRERPRLIFLASCESAGQGERSTADGGPLAAVGPRLAEAGIPAVIAMQGRVTMETIRAFAPAFFSALQRHGEIDRAVATARAAVSGRRDSWMPVLFMRLRNGRIWYRPGFAEDQDYAKWPALVANIAQGSCTPILGPYLNEPILGSPRELAEEWAEEYDFPLARHERNDLAQVAQFLAIKQDWNLPRTRFVSDAISRLLREFGPRLSGLPEKPPLRELFAAVSRLRREEGRDPYATLARLPFRIFVTACTDSLLGEALRAAGKQPVVDICRWKEELVQKPPSPLLKEPDYAPTPERPLVFHLFGLNSLPDSLVLTEDDFFDYLIGVSLNKKLIPPMVRDALVDRSLLFLGFHLEDWSFRILFRSLMSKEGRQRLERYANVAGQIPPEDGRFEEPDSARDYLQRYFGKSWIDIYWGSVEDFIKELDEAWQQHSQAVTVTTEEDPFY